MIFRLETTLVMIAIGILQFHKAAETMMILISLLTLSAVHAEEDYLPMVVVQEAQMVVA